MFSTIQLIHQICNSTRARYGWRVELKFKNQARESYILSKKQAEDLEECFGYSDYSTKNNAVFGAFYMRKNGTKKFLGCAVKTSWDNDVPRLADEFRIPARNIEYEDPCEEDAWTLEAILEARPIPAELLDE